MTEWEVKEHPDFFKDLDKLDKKDLEIFYKKKKDQTKFYKVETFIWWRELLS